MLTRFLASGDSQISLKYLFRMGKKNVSRIINETSRAIHQSLAETDFNIPTTESQWKNFLKNCSSFRML